MISNHLLFQFSLVSENYFFSSYYDGMIIRQTKEANFVHFQYNYFHFAIADHLRQQKNILSVSYKYL